MEPKIVRCLLRVGRIGRVPMLEYQMPRHHWHVNRIHPCSPLVNSCWEMAFLMLIFKAMKEKKIPTKGSYIRLQMSSAGLYTTLNAVLHCVILRKNCAAMPWWNKESTFERELRLCKSATEN